MGIRYSDYIDQTGSGKTALRLHIPVFVRKVLDFSFQSYVISGTAVSYTHLIPLYVLIIPHHHKIIMADLWAMQIRLLLMLAAKSQLLQIMFLQTRASVSYTHLDVYKRQPLYLSLSWRRLMRCLISTTSMVALQLR